MVLGLTAFRQHLMMMMTMMIRTVVAATLLVFQWMRWATMRAITSHATYIFGFIQFVFYFRFSFLLALIEQTLAVIDVRIFANEMVWFNFIIIWKWNNVTPFLTLTIVKGCQIVTLCLYFHRISNLLKHSNEISLAILCLSYIYRRQNRACVCGCVGIVEEGKIRCNGLIACHFDPSRLIFQWLFSIFANSFHQNATQVVTMQITRPHTPPQSFSTVEGIEKCKCRQI